MDFFVSLTLCEQESAAYGKIAVDESPSHSTTQSVEVKLLFPNFRLSLPHF